MPRKQPHWDGTGELPPWGTHEATMMGVAHPDFPHATEASREMYQHPTGAWWRLRYGNDVPTVRALLNFPDPSSAPVRAPERPGAPR